MKCLIVYCSSHGTTEKAVRFLSERLEGEVLAVDLKREKEKFDLSSFDTFIIGGSIHVGNIQRKIKQFIRNNFDTLLEKDVGLFLIFKNATDKRKTTVGVIRSSLNKTSFKIECTF